MKTKKKGGRPTKSDSQILKYRVVVKLCTVDYYTLKSKAKAAGFTLAELARQAITGVTIKARHTPETMELIRKLCGMDNNLNQIARKVNTYGYLTARTEYLHLAQEIDTIIKQFKR